MLRLKMENLNGHLVKETEELFMKLLLLQMMDKQQIGIVPKFVDEILSGKKRLSR